jgi:ABC-type glycerol-3-phosphate transport system substrate-binding protein
MASALRAVASASTVTNPNANAGTLQALLATAPKTDQDLINGQAYLSMPWIDPDPIATGDIFRAMIEDTVSGALKPQDALTRADKAMNQLLGI